MKPLQFEVPSSYPQPKIQGDFIQNKKALSRYKLMRVKALLECGTGRI